MVIKHQVHLLYGAFLGFSKQEEGALYWIQISAVIVHSRDSLTEQVRLLLEPHCLLLCRWV